MRHQNDLVLDSVLDRQPVKTSQYRRDVFGSTRANHRAGQRVLETLELIDVALGSTVEDTVAVIDVSSTGAQATDLAESQSMNPRMCRRARMWCPDERQMPSACLLKFREQSMGTPRFFTLSAILMSAPANLTESMGAFCRRRAPMPTMMASVLVGFRARPLRPNQS